MSLPNPADLISQMAVDLNAHLSKRAIVEPRFIGIRTGGVWVAQALLKALGSASPLGTLDVSFYRDDFSQNGLHPQVRPVRTAVRDRRPAPGADRRRADERPDHPRRPQRTLRLRPPGQRDAGQPAGPRCRRIADRPDVVGATLSLAPTERVKLSGPRAAPP